MSESGPQHVYQVGDAVVADFDGVLVPGVIEADEGTRFLVRLARAWTDGSERQESSVWLAPDRLRPYAGTRADRMLPAKGESAMESTPPDDLTNGGTASTSSGADYVHQSSTQTGQAASGTLSPEPLDRLQEQHDAAFGAWGEAFERYGYGSTEEEAAFAEVERLGLQLAEAKARL